MPKFLTCLALCAPLLGLVGCSDDDGANVPRNGPPGEGGSAGGNQGGAAGAGAGQGGSGGTADAGDAGGSAGCANAPDAGVDAGRADGGLSDAGLLDAGLLDAGVPDASGESGVAGLVSFARDIHPIFEAKCGPCHVDVGYAGHNVGGELEQAYVDAVGLGQLLLMRIDGGGMPPPDAPPPNDCDGDPGTPGCLTVEQVALVATWIAQCNPR